MKTKYRLRGLVIILFFVSFPCGAQNHLVFSRPGNRTGVAMVMGERILEEAYGRLGIDFEFLEYPSERALASANKGDTDGEFQRIAGLEENYPNLIMISFPIGIVDIVAYSKDYDFEIKGWKSISPYSIVAVRGFKLIEQMTEGMQVDWVTTSEQAFLMLNVGRCDIVVDSRSAPIFQEIINTTGIHPLEPPLDHLILYHYLHKKHQDLALKLEIEMGKMEQEGIIDEIVKQSFKDFFGS